MRTRSRITLAGLVLGIALVGSVAWAQIPGEDGTIQACNAKKTGALRVVETSADCSKDELSISWNQQGQQGDQGVAGTNGVNGVDGADGGPGPQGDPGAPGTNGTDGVNGTDGAPGTNGTNGTNGVSVTSQALPVGSANCANGGSRFTASDGTTYACNGAPGSAAGPGSVAAKGMIRFLDGTVYLNTSSRGAASVSLNAAGEFSVVYSTPSPCGAGSLPIPMVSFRNYGLGGATITEAGLSETGFIAVPITAAGLPLTGATDQIDFAFIVVC